MSILATELEWPEGTKFFEVQCRLGIWDVDGWDLDKEPEVKTLGGTVRITPRTPAGRIRLLEPDGKYRVVVAPPLTFAINEFTGKLVNTADNTEGVWVVDPASDTVDPKDFTYSAVVTPKVGSPFTVEFDGTVAINGVYDLANGTTVAPSRGVSVLESRIAKLEQEGGLPHGDIPIFATLDEAMAYEAANPGSLALTIESTEPDTTPPTLGTLTITPEGTKATAVVSGAEDDRGSVEYSFKLGSGAWTAWQAESRYTFTGLSLSTGYSATHRVRDRAGNTVEGYSQSFTTLTADMWGTLWVDSFANNADGPLSGQALDAPLTSTWGSGLITYAGTMRSPLSVVGGVVKSGGTSYVTLPKTPERVQIDVTAMGGGVERLPRLIIGADATHWNELAISRMSNTSTKWLHHDPAYTSHTQADTVVTDDTGAVVYRIGADGWAQHVFTFVIDYGTRAVEVLQDGVSLLQWTVPADKWVGGQLVGFATDEIEPTNGSVSAFSVRWE